MVAKKTPPQHIKNMQGSKTTFNHTNSSLLFLFNSAFNYHGIKGSDKFISSPENMMTTAVIPHPATLFLLRMIMMWLKLSKQYLEEKLYTE